MTDDQKAADLSLDFVLTEVGGFGLFQGYTFILLIILKFSVAFSAINYMISANTLEYRCKVPECDIDANNREIQFDQPWLRNAIPYSDDKIDNCYRYAPKNRTSDEYGHCSADMFDTSKKIECSEFVYESDEKSVQTEFNIHCSDSYKLALIGTIGNIGRFIGLPVFGLLADKYGRLPGLLVGITLTSVFALIKSFSINYYMYLILEFFEAFVCVVGFTAPYVIAAELLNAKNRVWGNTIMAISFPMGEMIFALAAMYIHDFRTLIRTLQIPGLFAFVYFWLIPESVRWLLVKGHVDRAVTLLKRIAKFNRKDLSTKSIEMLKLHYDLKSNGNMSSVEVGNNNDVEIESTFQSLGMIFKSKTFSLRFLNCCYHWATCTFSYYGLSLSAMHIPGANRYVSLIIIVACEIPGNFLSQALLPRMKRRVLMFSMMFSGAITIIAIPFIPKEYSIVVLMFFVLGKSLITCAFTSLYVFTMEQWPTNIRNTVLNSCSMIGRIGSMLAPLTAILAAQSASFPSLLFGGTAFLSSVLVLFSPETFGKKLPDTMQEAKDL